MNLPDISSYKALHNPSALSDMDLQACSDGLKAAMNWPQVLGRRRAMFSCSPIPFAFCSQYVTLLVLPKSGVPFVSLLA